MKSDTIKDKGLRGVFVADTSICLIDGVNGKLFYRGYNIQDLVKYSTYEEVAYLLVFGQMPKPRELEEFSSTLARERTLPQESLELLVRIPKTTSPMDMLQSAVALLAAYDPELGEGPKEAIQRKATRLIAKIPCVIASHSRVRNGLDPVAPSQENISHAANFLYMLTGLLPDAETARDFDVCLILHAEHSFNASTFVARVVASTRAHLYASVTAAIGALSGDLHGGANLKVMKNLLEIGDPSRVDSWVSAQFDQHRRVMGMGHAVYRTTDPRAAILREMSERLSKRSGDSRWYLMTRKIEEATRQEFMKRRKREIFANVDLYSASVYHMMGIPHDLYPAVFAVSRIAGWAAHVLEERFPEPPVKPTLYRPSADYHGNYCGPVGCSYVNIRERT